MTGRPIAIGVDVGGTNVRVATLDADGTLADRERASTPFGDGDALVDVVAKLVADRDPSLPVGIGMAGGITTDGRVLFSPNVGISDLPLGEAVAARIGRDVLVVNDASAAVWAEHRVGAARGHDDVLMLTVGTGVGGGAVVGGRLLTGATGLAGELGHTVVLEGGAPCACGNRGCLEAYAAGPALALGDASPSATVTAARAAAGPERTHVESAGRWLGVAMASLVAVLDPSVVVLGGGAGAQAFDLLAGPAAVALEERLFGRSHRTPPPLVAAAVGDDAGVIGAALLAAADGGAA